jgi:hypothetical protein
MPAELTPLATLTSAEQLTSGFNQARFAVTERW